MTAYTFTYNSYTPSQLLGRHTLRVSDGELQFSQKILINTSAAIGDSPGRDEDLKDKITAAIAALSVQNAAFTFALGAQTQLSWSHAANTGFLTRPTVTQIEHSLNNARTQILEFSLSAQREPQQSGRAGRREASLSIGYSTDRLRTVTFNGVWTSISTGPVAALAQYQAQLDTWANTWIGAGQLLAPQTGAVWQLIEEPKVQLDDENKALSFSLRYRETKFSSTPGDVANAIYTIGTFTRIDPGVFGAKILEGAGGEGEEDPFDEYAPIGGGEGYAATSVVAFRRYQVQTTTFVTDLTLNLDTFWTTYVRTWIDATVQAIFGTGRVIFEQPSIGIEDVANKRIAASCSILVASSGALIEYRERVERHNMRNLIAEYKWSGRPDDYDLGEGGRNLRIDHIVEQTRLDQNPEEPLYLGGAWEFEKSDDSQTAEIRDPVTQAITAYKSTHRRTYLYAPTQSGSSGSAITPAPLGSPGSGGGSVFTPGGGDDGIEDLP